MLGGEGVDLPTYVHIVIIRTDKHSHDTRKKLRFRTMHNYMHWTSEYVPVYS